MKVSMAIATEQLRAMLVKGLKDLALEPSPRLLDCLLIYLAQLEKWNKAYNLTAVRKPAAMVTRHLLDSYSVASYIGGSRVIDVGTGAGLPGIPLALLNPHQAYTLLDTNGKKVRFLEHVTGQLGLNNVSPVQARVEAYHAAGEFDTVVCRAFTSLADFIVGSGHLAGRDGQLVAMKGKLPEDELAELPEGWAVASVNSLHVPGLEAQRHAIVLRRA